MAVQRGLARSSRTPSTTLRTPSGIRAATRLAFDAYGNLFLSYLYNVEINVPIALSSDGGLSFHLIANIAKPAKTTGTGERQGVFRFVDQETIVTGAGTVWVVVNGGGPRSLPAPRSRASDTSDHSCPRS